MRSSPTIRCSARCSGAKDDLNREAVAAAAPQVIIDTGEAKKGAKEDLDALQEQLGIPVIFIEAKLSDYGAAYERLGELLSMEERGSELSTYCTDVYNKTVTTMENIPENERVRMAYLLGDNGLNAIAKTSFQAAVVDMVADNVVVVDDVSGKGNGNEISLEQIALWNPDLIVFQTGSIYDTVGDDPAWAGLAAHRLRQLLPGAQRALLLAEQPADGEPAHGPAVAAAPAVP